MPEKKVETRWSSFENRGAEKSAGGLENKGAKGHPFNRINAGESINLLDIDGSGTVQRIWLTFSDRSPEMLRSLVINMYWDNEEKPAVSVPIGDFFGVGLGKKVPFESVFFADPEGRAFLCFIPMPFKEGAKIEVVNQSQKDLKALFYDVNLTLEEHPEDLLYFHSYWNRVPQTELGEDFKILPHVEGKGRFLGTNMGVTINKDYKDSWFGEGEVKIFLDGDTDTPTLVGSGTEDYVGTAYGQGAYSQQYHGSPIADKENGEFAFYRYHVPDPVYFYDDIKVTVQQMGGAPQDIVKEFVKNGAKLQPVTIDAEKKLYQLLGEDSNININDVDAPKGWTNFYREDDVSATAYFYLNKPVSDLPSLQPVETRVQGLTQSNTNKSSGL
ncbi:glycoside hydrolase family 172 protein [Autumnicola musiva]|uniref:Glycoside hydrolase family 172 protein n=1 Tax=Autumnicola musiva TaxID=3075589 RepID=A0ABU3D998_9FLAO|nr:glycoside hydrolase family 172 protein [Zunongwangia sp. F117]MDT0678021.1 glycoside hydrolase family 172 protein [Zunongwangia sp. F117]